MRLFYIRIVCVGVGFYATTLIYLLQVPRHHVYTRNLYIMALFRSWKIKPLVCIFILVALINLIRNYLCARRHTKLGHLSSI